MCQTNVLMEKDGSAELLFENVMSLEVHGENVKITTLFEGLQSIPEVQISRIDFNAGQVFLTKIN